VRVQAPVFSAVALLLAFGCAPAGGGAGQGAEPGLSDRWLTAASALPLSPSGEVIRDAESRPQGYALLGQTFPDFSLLTPEGAGMSREDLRGKWTIVDVWGIWCGDCRRDAPLARELAGLASADGRIGFLSIHTPPGAARAGEAFGAFGSVGAYFASIGGGYPTVIDTDAGLREELAIAWTPTYLLVDPDLVIRAFRTDLSPGGGGGADRALAEALALAGLRPKGT